MERGYSVTVDDCNGVDCGETVTPFFEIDRQEVNLSPFCQHTPPRIPTPEVFMSPFSDPQAVARYAEGPRRLIPGFHGLQQMALLLLTEFVPEDGHVLVLGAGGGLETKRDGGI